MNAAMVQMPGRLPQGTTMRLLDEVVDKDLIYPAGTIVKLEADLGDVYMVEAEDETLFYVEINQVEECDPSEWNIEEA
jgi:hypothetical protein